MSSVCDYDTVEFASYVEETTLYSYGQRLDEVIEKLEIDVSKFLNGFMITVLKPTQESFNLY